MRLRNCWDSHELWGFDVSEKYSSVLGPYISGLVATKKATGYTYESAEFYLRDFDRYCSLRTEGKCLSRELVLEWVKAKDGESPRTHRTRISQACASAGKRG